MCRDRAAVSAISRGTPVISQQNPDSDGRRRSWWRRMVPQKVPAPEWWLLTMATAIAVLTYHRIQTGTLNFTTGMLFLTALWLLAFLVAETLMRGLVKSADQKNKTRLLVITIGTIAFAVEIFSRLVLGSHATHMERNGIRDYFSYHQVSRPSWFHVHIKNGQIRYPQVEFRHYRETNSIGLAEREFSVNKAPREYRIIALGDSFTEGTGTSYDSSWVRVVERNLRTEFPDWVVAAMNAGIAGSDVFFEYILLREQLLPYDPDLVIVAVNSSDVQDIMVRGGMERFRPDGTTRFAMTSPKWEWLYAISFTFRHVVHDLLRYDRLFMKPEQASMASASAVNLITTALDAFASLATTEGFDLLIVIHPHQWEVRGGQYVGGFADVISHVEDMPDIRSVDLMDFYLTNEIITEANVAEFYWPMDTHHNGAGYQMMGGGITDAILRLQLISDSPP